MSNDHVDVNVVVVVGIFPIHDVIRGGRGGVPTAKTGRVYHKRAEAIGVHLKLQMREGPAALLVVDARTTYRV